jgi:ATP-dependent Lhr-like helicase
MRDVLLGTDPPGVGLSKRATTMLGELREHNGSTINRHGTVLHQSADGDVHWWTWAGTAANRTLHASLDSVDPKQRIGDRVLRLRHGIDLHEAAAELRESKAGDLADPPVNPFALRGLKFSAALPESLATDTVARRLGDRYSAALALREDRALIRE